MTNTKQQQKSSEKNTDEKHVVAERFHTKMCRNFMTSGQCPYHGKCMFAHGADDLRTKEMNLRDGLTTEEAIRNWKSMMVLKAEARARLEQLHLTSHPLPFFTPNYAPATTSMMVPTSYPEYSAASYERSTSNGTDTESVTTQKSSGNGFPYKGNPKITVHDPYAATVFSMAP